MSESGWGHCTEGTTARKEARPEQLRLLSSLYSWTEQGSTSRCKGSASRGTRDEPPHDTRLEFLPDKIFFHDGPEGEEEEEEEEAAEKLPTWRGGCRAAFGFL